MLLTFPFPRVMSRLLGGSARAAAPRVTRWFAAHVPHRRTREIVPPPGHVTLHCRSGQAWLTHDGDPRDVTLETNESYAVQHGGRITVFALNGDCMVEVQVED